MTIDELIDRLVKATKILQMINVGEFAEEADEGFISARAALVAEFARIEAELAQVKDELEKMKIRCILKLDPDSPIQKLDIGPQPPAGDRSDAK